MALPAAAAPVRVQGVEIYPLSRGTTSVPRTSPPCPATWRCPPTPPSSVS
jgi:hypothetical protein